MDGKIKLMLFRIPLYASTVSHMFSVTVTQASFFLAFPYLAVSAVRGSLWRKLPLLLPIGLWIAWIIVGSFFIPDRSHLLKQVFSWWKVLFFFFIYLAIRLGERPERLSLLAIASSVVISFYGIFQFFALGTERATGVFTNSLTYSNNLAMTAVAIMTWLLFSYKSFSKDRLPLLLALSVILMGIVAGLSRMVVYSIFLLGAILLILRYRLRAFLAITFAVVVFVLTTFNHPAFERLYNRGQGVVISNSTRVVLWKSALAMIKDHPVFGVGVHIFPRLIDSYAGGQTLDAKGHAHNAYLQAALDYGIPGFVLLIWIFLSLALLLIRHFKKTGSIWALVGLSVLSIYLLEGLTENNFGDAEVSMYFWSIQGLVTGVLESQDEKSVHG